MNRRRNLTEWIKYLIALPFAWIPLLPILLLDLLGEIYHHLGFRMYNIPLVKRTRYIKIDRHKLKYLPPHMKLGCMYCGYANGLAAYFAEIAARSERYFCAIQHQKDPNFKQLGHHKRFLKYGDEKSFRKSQP